MTFWMILIFGEVPLPTIEQHLLMHKESPATEEIMMPGDYWAQGHDFDVVNYDIDLSLNIPADTVWGEMIMTLVALSGDLDTVDLNFHWGFKVEAIKERTRTLNWKTVSGGDLKIALDREVPAGETLQILIDYHGKPAWANGHGLFIDSDDEWGITFTNCEPDGARLWIPCFDDPSDKATFTQRITVPSGYEIVANGSLEEESKQGAWWTYTWQEHYPQPTYLIAFAASEYFLTKDTFATVEGNTVPMRAWCMIFNDQLERFDCTPGIIEYFSVLFPPYPFADEKYDQVHTPIGGAMENTTNTFINTFIDWGTDWSPVISHELSHDWWGDWITCATWADIWLNEGFATYCEALWWEKQYGFDGYRAYARLTMDTYLEYGDPHPIYDPLEVFGVNSYDKGGSVMHMLRQVLGDSVFFGGLRQYADENANESVITDDFQNVMEEYSGKDLDWFFDAWIFGRGHPHYEIGWKVTPQSGGMYDVEFAIAQTQDQNIHYFPFRMPLEVAVYVDGTQHLFPFTDSIGYQRFTVEVDGEPDYFTLDPWGKVLCVITQYDNIDDVPYIEDIDEVDVNPGAVTLSVDPLFSCLLRVRFAQPGERSYELSLFDASGRFVRALNHAKSRDLYRVYPLHDLSAGVYFVRAELSSGEVFTARTVKIR